MVLGVCIGMWYLVVGSGIGYLVFGIFCIWYWYVALVVCMLVFELVFGIGI